MKRDPGPAARRAARDSSTGSCPSSTTCRACSRSPRTPSCRCWSGRSSWRSSATTSTSSTRSASPGCSSSSVPGSARPRPTGSTSSTSSAPSAGRSTPSSRGPTRSSPRRCRPRSRTPASRFVAVDDLSADDRRYVDELFAERIFPVLTPLAVDPAHPFPYISNLSLNLAVTVRDPDTRRAALRAGEGAAAAPAVRAARRRPAVRAARAGDRARTSTRCSPGWRSSSHHPFRVTRDADFEIEDEAEDLLEAVESVLRRRSRFGVVGAPRGRHHDDERGARPPLPRARAVGARTSRPSTARSTSAACSTSTRSTAPS